MAARHRRSTALISALTVLLLAIALPACGGSSPAGFTVKAPVLWAGPGNNGQIQSGIENATVSVTNRDNPGFSVDLASVAANEAGPQWLAASASAAAVATILCTCDPTTVDVSFTITGQIDGPSGGAMLTVATLAAIRQLRLDEKITMTGTISPDGSVGRVGEIPAKLRGAAKAGYKKVLLPVSNLVASGEPSTSDMVEYGRTLGLEVLGVEDIAAAFTEFTGETVYPSAAAAPPRAAVTTDLVTLQTTRLLDRIRAESRPTTTASITSGLDRAAAALRAGDVATAYGLGTDTYTLLIRENATTAMTTTIAAGGQSGALDSLRRTADELAVLSATSIDAIAATPGLDAVAQLSLPFSMGWVTWAHAIVLGIKDALAKGTIVPTAYAVTAAALAEQRAAIEVFGPDAVEVVVRTANPSVTTAVPPGEFLSGYTNLLVEAGKANKNYLESVVGSRGVIDSSGTPVFTALGLNALSNTVENTAVDTQSLTEEIRQSALAVTYFVFGTGLVSNTGANGIIGTGVGADTRSTVTIPGLINTVLIADSGVKAMIDLLAARGVDAAYPRWSANWGVAAAEALNGSGRDSAGEYLALNELWYDDINCTVLYAATTVP